MAQVDLDLTQVLALLQKMRRIRMTQGMDVGLFGDATGSELRAMRKARCKVVRHIGSAAVRAPRPL